MKFSPMFGWALRGLEFAMVIEASTSIASLSLWEALIRVLKRLKLLFGRVPCEYFSEMEA